jgi:antitoxin VapB
VIYIKDAYQVISMSTAKLFWTGRSQAVRLPKEYRFEGEEVRIRREGNAVVLEPIPKDWKWLDDLADSMKGEFLSEGIEEPAPQERPELDELFR